jgi:hypothetical protein
MPTSPHGLGFNALKPHNQSELQTSLFRFADQFITVPSENKNISETNSAGLCELCLAVPDICIQADRHSIRFIRSSFAFLPKFHFSWQFNCVTKY